jgi:hypothetical protein
MPLTPLPDQLFASLEALLEAAKAYAANHSYAITILRSKKNKKGILYKVWLKCDRGGKYRARDLTDDNRVRLTGTRCIECPFSAIGKLNPFGEWVLVSIIIVIY